jgi:menaquinone-dependent protoporphyrinogen oxidase
MARILVVCGTVEGQTAKIADFIGRRIESRGHVVRRIDAGSVEAEWSSPEFDAVLIAASIHAGRHDEAIYRYVQENRDLLEAVPTAFLSVSLSGRDDAHRGAATAFMDRFFAEVGWTAGRSLTVGGALRYSRYGVLERAIMKRVARREGLPTDSRRDWEFTDWPALEAFADAFAVEVRTHRCAACPDDLSLAVAPTA